MRKLRLIFFLHLCGTALIGQWLPEGYELDGVVGMVEYQDTVHFRKVFQDEHLLIKESKDAYYVAIQSNALTIGNAYYLDDAQLKIMHVSAAAGETNYNRVDGEWSKDRPEWDWRHRDPHYWGEMHENPLQDVKAYYDNFNWVGTTVAKGSYREMEFLLSKKLIRDYKRLRISFMKQTPDGAKLVIGPGENMKVVMNEELNLKLHMGELPAELTQ